VIDRAELPDLFAELLAKGHRATLRARGGSMWPAIRDGDVLTLAPLRAGDEGGPPAVRPGDVVALRCGEALVVHRVVRCEGGGVVLRGDALPREDGAFAASAILGRVVAVRRGSQELRLGRGALAPLQRLVLRALRKVRAW
jgi:phage repressor protein C with HTH and peptisase S24 domain